MILLKHPGISSGSSSNSLSILFGLISEMSEPSQFPIRILAWILHCFSSQTVIVAFSSTFQLCIESVLNFCYKLAGYCTGRSSALSLFVQTWLGSVHVYAFKTSSQLFFSQYGPPALG